MITSKLINRSCIANLGLSFLSHDAAAVGVSDGRYLELIIQLYSHRSTCGGSPQKKQKGVKER